MSEIDLEIARIAGRQHAVLSIERLRVLGLSRAQVKRRKADGRLHPQYRGVYSVGHRLLTQHGRWMAAVLALRPGALLSHTDGTALWDLRKPGGGAIHVTVEGRARRRRHGLIVHVAKTLHPDDRAIVDGIPVTSVPRTLLDLAEVVALPSSSAPTKWLSGASCSTCARSSGCWSAATVAADSEA